MASAARKKLSCSPSQRYGQLRTITPTLKSFIVNSAGGQCRGSSRLAIIAVAPDQTWDARAPFEAPHQEQQGRGDAEIEQCRGGEGLVAMEGGALDLAALRRGVHDAQR